MHPNTLRGLAAETSNLAERLQETINVNKERDGAEELNSLFVRLQEYATSLRTIGRILAAATADETPHPQPTPYQRPWSPAPPAEAPPDTKGLHHEPVSGTLESVEGDEGSEAVFMRERVMGGFSSLAEEAPSP